LVQNPRTFSDVKGSFDRGPREFKSHKVRREGEIMSVAQRRVVSTHPANSIKNVAKLMQDNDFRRLPVTDAGTGRLEGMARAIDILDFLGGGEKYNILLKDYSGNFLSAINCPISKLMAQSSYLTENAKVEEAVKILLERRTSLIPIVSNAEELRVTALISERDVMPQAADFGIKVGDVMQTKVITATDGMMLSDVAKIMVRNGLRRLPVIKEDSVIGVVTVFDALKYLSGGNYKGVYAEENLSTRVNEIMEHSVVSVKPSDDLGVVVRLVSETNLGGFPVVEDGKLAGIVTTTDVIRKAYAE
jgi:CBS domain-containing protein